MKIYSDISALIGNTPLIELSGIKKKYGFTAKLLAKVEFFNPTGSVKDRAAKYMLDDAEKKGHINKDSVIIEPTSGNTGIGLAALAASRGYSIILTMSETMSIERRKLLAAYGAKIVLTEGAKGMKGAIEKAEALLKETPNSFMPGQFTSQANVTAHKETTGPEIWQDTDGTVDIFIAGIGTGGTITGTSEYLKSQNSEIKVYGVEPAKCPFISEGCSGKHAIQGIGAGFVPPILNEKSYDALILIDDDDAFSIARQVAKTDGLLVGISSGAALSAAIQLACKPENAEATIVVLLPDTGERYLSTDLFENEK